MAQSLRAFFAQNAEHISNRKLVVSNRFRDENGQPIEWEIRALTAGDRQDIRAAALTIGTVTKGTAVKMHFDSAKSNKMLAAAAVVFPDLKDAALQDSYGVMNDVELIGKMLYEDELNKLIEAVNELAAGTAPEELEEEAKN